MLRKAGGNRVDGDRFFDRTAELDALAERCRERTHTLLTAQRRMGKTSLVRELLRRFKATGEFETLFVNLEDSLTAADAIAEIGTESTRIQSVWERIRTRFANQFRDIAARVESLEGYDLKVKLRAGIDSGNWRQGGDDRSEPERVQVSALLCSAPCARVLRSSSREPPSLRSDGRHARRRGRRIQRNARCSRTE